MYEDIYRYSARKIVVSGIVRFEILQRVTDFRIEDGQGSYTSQIIFNAEILQTHVMFILRKPTEKRKSFSFGKTRLFTLRNYKFALGKQPHWNRDTVTRFLRCYQFPSCKVGRIFSPRSIPGLPRNIYYDLGSQDVCERSSSNVT